ncbi:MAG: hypothetical protein ICV79_29370 [Flavisolibacter sp.]|nr:hypothetical protein [Flavisolibacter sp.]
MQQQTSASRVFILVTIILMAAVIRILLGYTGHSHFIFSLTPLGAMFIFGSAYFKGWIKPFLFPFLALFISDVILCFTIYSSFREGLLYSGWYWTYSAFFLMALTGKLIIKEVRVKNILLAVISAVIVHWLASNAGPCIESSDQNNFFSLYGNRLISAVSSEIRLLIGTLLYAVLMFGGFELSKGRYKQVLFR